MRPLLRLLPLFLLLSAAHAQLQAPLDVSRGAVGRLVSIDPETRTEGKGLAIQSYSAEVVIRGRLAETTITQVFANDSDRQLEGTFYFPLPAGTSLSRFAMDVNGEIVEGEIVERRRGRRIYEDIVRSMKDPALLEMTEGNTFKARVFPIPARGTKMLILGFTQELPLVEGAARYTLPLQSEAFASHKVKQFELSVDARAGGGYAHAEASFAGTLPELPRDSFEMSWKHEGAPRRDFTLSLRPTVNPGTSLDVCAGEDDAPGYFLARIASPLALASGVQPNARRVVLLVDTSASTNHDQLEASATLVESLLWELARQEVDVAVVAFDCTPVDLLGMVPAGTVDAAAIARSLRERGSLGGSDLSAALGRAKELLSEEPMSHDTIVLVSDGLATMGETDPGKLLALAADLDAQILPLPVGSQHNQSLLGALARNAGGLVTVAIPGTELPPIAARVAQLATPFSLVTDVTATITDTSGATREIALDNFVPGEEVQVTGRADPAVKHVVIEGSCGKETNRFEILADEVTTTANPHLPRHWAARHLEALLAVEQTAEIKAEVIALSERYGIMTPYTVFLVLESEEAYRQHRIERRNRVRRLAQRESAEPRDHSGGDPRRGEGDAGDVDEDEQASGERARMGLEIEELAREEAEPEAAVPHADALDDEVLEELEGSSRGLNGFLGSDPSAPAGNAGEEPLSTENNEDFEEERAGDQPMPARPAPSSPPAAPAERPDDSHADAAKKGAKTRGLAVAKIGRDELASLGITFTPGGDATLQPANPVGADAIKQAMAAVDAQPRSRNARKQLGLVLLAAGDHETLSRWSRDWISIDPRNLTPYLHLGKALSNMGKAHAHEALRAFTSLVDVRPGEAKSHRVLGRLLVNYGQLEEARTQFRKAMEDRPDDPSGLQDLAQLAVAAGDFGRAADLFANLAERDWPSQHGPVKDLAVQQLGMLYLRLEQRCRQAGDDEAASIWVEKRAKLGSDHFKPRDVKVLINWDTAGTDVDLWVTGPDGVKCFYQQKNTPMGGNLYADITTGFGPEIYYLDEAARGEYLIRVHYYSARDADDSLVRALVVLFEGTERQEIHEVDLTLHQTGDLATVASFTLK